MTDVPEVAAAFEGFELATHDPKWSSGALDRLVAIVPGDDPTTMTTLLQGFDLALKRNHVRLTASVANLVRDVGVSWVLKSTDARTRADWTWARPELASGLSAARAYLFLRVLPPEQMTPASLLAILLSLERTPQFDEALHALADDFERPAVLEELNTWRANGMESQVAGQIDVFLQNH